MTVNIIHGSVFYSAPEDETLNEQSTMSRLVGSIIPIIRNDTTKENPKTPTVTRKATDPIKLSIPSAKVKANIQYVGRTTKGNMGSPTNFSEVAWYKHGTVPGETGSAVMAGHVDNALALAGVFKNLKNLKIGDDVYVTRHDGNQLHFVVQDIQRYPYNAIPTDTIFNRNDGAYLNLVTCEGEWLQDQKTYEERLVVYTKLVQ
jgi:sortase A